MVGVCIRYESEFDYNQWLGVLSPFKCSEIYVRDADDEINGFKPKGIAVNSAADLPSDRPLVVISPYNSRGVQGDVSLVDFEHPENAIYVFGPNKEHNNVIGHNDLLTLEDDMGGREPDYSVFIPTFGNMYSYVCGSVVLYDLMVKTNGDYR